MVYRTKVLCGNFSRSSIVRSFDFREFNIAEGSWDLNLEKIICTFHQTVKNSIVGVCTNQIFGYNYDFHSGQTLYGSSIIATFIMDGEKGTSKEIYKGDNCWRSFSNGQTQFDISLLNVATLAPFSKNVDLFFQFNFRRIE